LANDDNLPRYLRPPAGKLLNRWGRQFWKDNAGDLYRAELLKETDVASFIMLCQAFGLAMESATKIGEEGLFRQDENNITRKHPATQVHRDSVAMFNRLADKFALNPRARQTMKIGDGDGVTLHDLLFSKAEEITVARYNGFDAEGDGLKF
jgi:P27 family predicted phage terminase small subunit